MSNNEIRPDKVEGHLSICGCAGCSFLRDIKQDEKIKLYEIALKKIAIAPSIYCSSIAREVLNIKTGDI